MFSAGARASTRRFLLLGGGGLLPVGLVVDQGAAWLGLGAPRAAAALKWGLGEWIHKRCARKRPRGAAGDRAAFEATRAVRQRPTGAATGRALGTVEDSRGCSWLHAPCQTSAAARPESTQGVGRLRLLSVLFRRRRLTQKQRLDTGGAPRVRRLSNPPPRPKNTLRAILTSAPFLPGPIGENRRTVNALAPSARWRSSQCHVVTRRTTPHTEAILRM